MDLSSLPRVRLASLPTPLQELPNLTKLLKGPGVRMKRDELTGLPSGGKTRKLECLIDDAHQVSEHCLLIFKHLPS